MLSREDIEHIAADGREAFERGMPISACPYRQHDVRYGTWVRGFQNAQFGARITREGSNGARGNAEG